MGTKAIMSETNLETPRPFINRRKGNDRRYDEDPCSNLPVDLYHQKRRKSKERRAQRTLAEDYYAFTNGHSTGEKTTKN